MKSFLDLFEHARTLTHCRIILLNRLLLKDFGSVSRSHLVQNESFLEVSSALIFIFSLLDRAALFVIRDCNIWQLLYIATISGR